MSEDLIWASLFLGLGSLLFLMSVAFLVYMWRLVNYLAVRHGNPFQTISDIFSSVYDALENEPQLLCGNMCVIWWCCPMKGDGQTEVNQTYYEVQHFRFRNFVLGMVSIVALMVTANVMAFLAFNEVKHSVWAIVVLLESAINIVSLLILYPWQFSMDAPKSALDACFCYSVNGHNTVWRCCFLPCQPQSICCCCCGCASCFRCLHLAGTIFFFLLNPLFNMAINAIKYAYPGRSVGFVWAYMVLTLLYGAVLCLFLFVFFSKSSVEHDFKDLSEGKDEVISDRERDFWKTITRKGVEGDTPVVNTDEEAPQAAQDNQRLSLNQPPDWPPNVCGYSINPVYLELACIGLIIAANLIDLVAQFFEID